MIRGEVEFLVDAQPPPALAAERSVFRELVLV